MLVACLLEKPSARLRRAFELAGAAAGVVFLVYLVGGLVTWQRFRTLGLAEEASVAALPREGLLVAGLLALKSPLILGLLVLLFYVCLDEVWKVEREAAGSEKARRARLGGVVLVGVLIAAVIAVGLYAGTDSMAIVAVGGAIAIVAARMSSRTDRRGLIAYGIFIAVAVTGAVVEDLAIKAPPTHLEPAAVFLDGVTEPVQGYFIAESSSFVYLAGATAGFLPSGSSRARVSSAGHRRASVGSADRRLAFRQGTEGKGSRPMLEARSEGRRFAGQEPLMSSWWLNEDRCARLRLRRGRAARRRDRRRRHHRASRPR